MKTFLKLTAFSALLLILASIATSCNDNGKEEPPFEETPNSVVIHAQVENAEELGDISRVSVFTRLTDLDSAWPIITRDSLVAYGDWKDDGFTIKLPKTIDRNLLYSLVTERMSTGWIYDDLRMEIPFLASFGAVGIGLFRGAIDSTTFISNRNVKGVTIEFLGLQRAGAGGLFSFFPTKIVDGVSIQTVFTYVDSDVTILGNNIQRYDDIFPGFDFPHRHHIYSIEWRRGWNVWYLSRSETINDDGISVITTQWSSQPPIEGLRWQGMERNRHGR